MPITTESKYSTYNKHYMVVFYKIFKKYDEIQLTKNKMNLNNRKLKIIHPPLDFSGIIMLKIIIINKRYEHYLSLTYYDLNATIAVDA